MNDAAARWGIIGHDAVVQSIAAALAAGRVAHAWLITGSEGVGRTALALALARALQCESAPESRPCGVCDTCRRIARGSHPDVTLVDMVWQKMIIGRAPGSRQERRSLSIDAIRWLRQDIATRPLMGRWKVHIIDDADRLSDTAPEAYLKTLEEPPAYAVIVLVASSEDVLPETILSRCRHLTLGAVPVDTIRAALLARDVAPDTAERIARAARGRAGWALRMAARPDELLQRAARIEEAYEQLTTPLGRMAISGVIARDYSKKREETAERLALWTGLWRDALLTRSGLNDQIAYPEVADRLASWARGFEISDLYRAVSATRRCQADLNANVLPRIALTAMVMQWPE